MHLIKSALHRDRDTSELLVSNSRKVIYTVGVIYLIWHMLATLAWAEVFSPSLWAISALMLATIIITLRLLQRVYWLAQVSWFLGLTLSIIGAYGFYHSTEITFGLALLPMMAVVMIGLRGTILVEAVLIALVVNLWRVSFLPMLPNGYELALVLVFLTTGGIGWGLANNLMSATDAALFHYKEVMNRLEETRRHRAEITVLLKEQSQTNYQLERLNKMLEYARARAEEAREERDRFALAVSHELRSPLNFIIGFSDLMVNSPETYAPPEEWPRGLHEDIQQVYHSSTHLLSLINDILDMGRMDARQMPLFKERADLAAIIAQVCEMTTAACEQKGISLLTDIEADLPQLYIDRTRIRQVLLNLVTNAMRFTSRGSITVRAHLKQADRVEIQVQDTGAGIASDDLGKLFEEFRQVENPTNWLRREGTGLGLAIGRRFVQLHGGEMSASSEVGLGSTFWFTLPVHPPIDEMEASSTAMMDQLLQQRRLKQAEESNSLLLFLSEQPFWAQVFAETLTDYQVHLLTDPNQLALQAAQLYPRALLLDQMLAQHPAVKQLMQAPPYDLPIITLALPVDVHPDTALPQGVLHYLVKPVPRQELIKAVHSLGSQVRQLLVVDDDPGMVRFLIQALRSAENTTEQLPEFTILTAQDAEGALACLRHQQVDAILLDLELPDMNGLELLERIRTCHVPAPPVIVISANDMPRQLSARKVGVLEVQVARAFNRKELADAVSTLIEKIQPGYNQPQ